MLDPIIGDKAGNWYAGDYSGQPTSGAAQVHNGGPCTFGGQFPIPCGDASITKLDANGNVVFSARLGSTGDNETTALAVDAAQNVYAAGVAAGGFPTTPGAANSTGSRSFVAKLSADGSRFLYVTLLSTDASTAAAVAVDAQGNAYVTGMTRFGHVYVTKLDPTGSTVLYNVTLGGSQQEAVSTITAVSAITLDSAGDAIVAGQTNSSGFPVTAMVVQPTLRGAQNAFVTKLDAAGNILFSTFLGGTRADRANAVAVDGSDNVFVAGQTTSLDFPTTAGSFQSNPAIPAWSTSPGGFIAKLKPDASALLYASYIPSEENPTDYISNVPTRGSLLLAVTFAGDAYIAGVTGPQFPATSSAPQPCSAGFDDFLVHLGSDGTLRDATYVTNPQSFVVSSLVPQPDGSIGLVSSIAGLYSLFKVRFGDAGSIAPNCLSPALLNAATFRSTAQVSPGEIVTLTGVGIGPEAGVSSQPDAQGMLPRSLGGVQVLFDGVPVPLLYAQSGQVNAQVPYEYSGNTAATVSLQYNNVTFGPITTTVSFAVPGILRAQPGLTTLAYAINEDGTFNGPANPAAKGSAIAMWATGLGPMNPECLTGGINAPGPIAMANDYGVTVQGYPMSPFGFGASTAVDPNSLPVWKVEYAGGAPGKLCGVQQLNVRIPADSPSGEIVIVTTSIHPFSPDGEVNLQSIRWQSEGMVSIFVK